MIKMLHFATISPLAQQTAGGGFNPTILLFYGLIMAAMWFLLIAPQRKKQKEQQKMISNTKVEVEKAFIHTVVRKSGQTGDQK